MILNHFLCCAVRRRRLLLLLPPLQHSTQPNIFQFLFVSFTVVSQFRCCVVLCFRFLQTSEDETKKIFSLQEFFVPFCILCDSFYLDAEEENRHRGAKLEINFQKFPKTAQNIFINFPTRSKLSKKFPNFPKFKKKKKNSSFRP